MSKLNKYSEDELRRLVESQKRTIYRMQDSVNEARDIAKQLLFELRQHVETPATHVSYHWLSEPDAGEATTEERQSR